MKRLLLLIFILIIIFINKLALGAVIKVYGINVVNPSISFIPETGWSVIEYTGIDYWETFDVIASTGYFYHTDYDNFVYIDKRETNTGNLEWRYIFIENNYARGGFLAQDNEYIYICKYRREDFYAVTHIAKLLKTNGQFVNESIIREISSDVIPNGCIVDDNYLYVYVNKDIIPVLYKLNKNDFSIIWSVSENNIDGSPIPYGLGLRRIYYDDQYIYTVNRPGLYSLIYVKHRKDNGNIVGYYYHENDTYIYYGSTMWLDDNFIYSCGIALDSSYRNYVYIEKVNKLNMTGELLFIELCIGSCNLNSITGDNNYIYVSG
ncbi:MAG: hypothetical protein QXH95_03410 [Thermoplasmata archaeon]